MGIVHKPDPGWASHIPILIKCLSITEGPVLELGVGIFSTPLLHALCANQNRMLLSMDSDSRFIDMFKKFRSPGHRIELVEDWSTQPLDQEWAVALVDQKPAEARAPSVEHLTDSDYVIIHDSNDPIYDYESIYPLFKYRYDHKYLHHTTVLSNKHDVNKLHNPLPK